MSKIFSPNAGRLGDSWHLDEVFIRINGKQHYLWRAVDQDGDVIDILVQPRRDQRAAERFFKETAYEAMQLAHAGAAKAECCSVEPPSVFHSLLSFLLLAELL